MFVPKIAQDQKAVDDFLASITDCPYTDQFDLTRSVTSNLINFNFAPVSFFSRIDIDKFKKAEELIMQGVPFYKAMEQTNINVTTLTSKRIKYLRALKEIKDRKSEDKLQEQFEKVVNCLMEGHPISAIGVMVGISMPLFMYKLTQDQKSVIQELRDVNKMNNSIRGTYQKKREDEKVTQLTAEEKTMLYNGELQICYSDLKNASSIIADVFPEDTTISFFESATNFLTGWKLGMWKTDNMAFENVKVVEV